MTHTFQKYRKPGKRVARTGLSRLMSMVFVYAK